MKTLRIAILSVVTLALAACVDEDTLTGGGGADRTAPTVTAVVPVDAYHIDVKFSEPLLSSFYAETTNFALVERAFLSQTHGSAPGDPNAIVAVRVKDEGKTATLSTASSMAGTSYDLTVKALSDHNGNMISRPVVKRFVGSSTPDKTPPQVTGQYPAPDVTGVQLGQYVFFGFAEGVTMDSVSDGVSWSTDQGPVSFTLSLNGGMFYLFPTGALAGNTLHTVTLSGIQDPAGNTMADTEWSFTTVGE